MAVFFIRVILSKVFLLFLVIEVIILVRVLVIRVALSVTIFGVNCRLLLITTVCHVTGEFGRHLNLFVPFFLINDVSL